MRNFLAFFIFFISNNLFSQKTQIFTKNFTYGSFYGQVVIKTKPITFSAPYLIVRLDKVIIQGMSYEGFNDGRLKFPIICKDCYIDVNGEAYMKIRNQKQFSSGNFKTRVFVNDLLNNNPEVKFSKSTIELHNKIRNKYNDESYWEITGRVSTLEIGELYGAHLGEIKDLAQEIKRDYDFNRIIKSTENLGNQESQLELKLSRYEQALAIKDDAFIKSEVIAIKRALKALKAKQTMNSQPENFPAPSLDKSTDISDIKTSDIYSSEERKKQYIRQNSIEKERIKTEIKAAMLRQRIEKEKRDKADKELDKGNYIGALNLYNELGDKNSEEKVHTRFLSDGLVKLFTSDPEARKMKKEYIERYKSYKQNTLKEEITGGFSNEGLAPKKNKRGWYGYVNTNGDWIIKPKYLRASEFKNGNAIVTTKLGEEITINTKGKKI